MGKPGRATQGKRNRERTQQERKQEKLALRVQRKEEASARDVNVEQGVDPDLIGIFPGPQPRDPWQEEQEH